MDACKARVGKRLLSNNNEGVKRMKKQYISPSTLVITVTSQSHILNSSPGILTNERSASGSSAVLSRQGDGFWDDEE